LTKRREGKKANLNIHSKKREKKKFRRDSSHGAFAYSTNAKRKDRTRRKKSVRLNGKEKGVTNGE